MEPLHARYPFLSAARGAVEAADVDLASVASDAAGPVVRRALERVETAVESGTVGAPRRSDRTELLSYPVARVLVSLAGGEPLIERYAHAEAATARERFVADIEADTGYRSVERERLTLDELLGEFDLGDAVTPVDGGPTRSGSAGPFRVDVGPYLRLTDGLDDPDWRLVNRALADGAVRVTREELYSLLEAAIRERVAAGLPLEVPDAVAAALEDPVAAVRERLADRSFEWEIDAVEPDRFPPCVVALRERVAAGEPVAPHSRFALIGFLAAAGMDADRIVAELAEHPDLDAGRVREQVAYLTDADGPVYPMPSCTTMQAYGDCVNMDALCDRIAHPLEYYERRLAGDDAVLGVESE